MYQSFRIFHTTVKNFSLIQGLNLFIPEKYPRHLITSPAGAKSFCSFTDFELQGLLFFFFYVVRAQGITKNLNSPPTTALVDTIIDFHNNMPETAYLFTPYR